MRIKQHKSATFEVRTDNTSILSDPWFVDGEYYGAWYHVPPYRFDPREFDSVDAIYISHIHPDHMSRKTLEKLNKGIPVYIHRYESPFLRKNIEELDFKVVEVENGKSVRIGDDLVLSIYAADNCDPEKCGKFFGCAPVEVRFGSTQIDSLSVISDGTHNILNVNDCPYALCVHTLDLVIEKHGHIDFLLTGYGGAGPYPQCFANLNEGEKLKKAKEKEAQFIGQAERIIEKVRPSYFMPFAGTYILGGKLHRLNRYRGVPHILDAAAQLEKFCREKKLNSRGIVLSDRETFNLQTKQRSGGSPIWSKDRIDAYTEKELSDRLLEYERDPMPSLQELRSLSQRAFERFLGKSQSLGFTTQTKVVVPMVEGRTALLDLERKEINFMSREEAEKPNSLLVVEVDPRLLARLLKGPRFAHWNNAEIGSHITFKRRPDVFERGLYYCMSFFHA